MITMKIDIYNMKAEKSGSVEIKNLVPVRPDIIKKAVLALQSSQRQPYGSAPDAGMRHSADVSRRRRKYRGSYGKGISRVPRKVHTRRGIQFFWVGAEAPGTVGGRRAHSPKASKIWAKAINRKERRLAITSAIAATFDRELVVNRGHVVPDTYPLAITADIEQMSKTQEVMALLEKLGFSEEIERKAERKIRAGKGTMRGRKYQGGTSLLIVVSENCPLKDALGNVRGIDVARIDELNAELLAPGTHPGRATVFTDKALERYHEVSA